jgi:hypothetical protein
MNLHSVTPSDLKKFQIERYSEMLLKPRSDNHKKFLKNELKRLQNDMDKNRNMDFDCGYRILDLVQNRDKGLRG